MPPSRKLTRDELIAEALNQVKKAKEAIGPEKLMKLQQILQHSTKATKTEPTPAEQVRHILCAVDSQTFTILTKDLPEVLRAELQRNRDYFKKTPTTLH